MADADIQTSFDAGELSPALYARVDLAKFATGAALLRNWFVDYRGGVSNRAGTRYIDTTVAGARLIPFIVSTEAAYVLVFSNQLITVYNQGVLITTVVTPYLTADLFTLAYTQSADVLTLVHPSYPPADLSRTDAFTFAYNVITTGPDVDPPVITTMVAPHSGPYSFGYLVTAVDLDGKEESLPSNPGVKHSEGMNELTNRVIGLSWTAPSEGVSRYNVYKWGPIDAVTLNPATVWGFIGSSQTTTFTDNNIAPDFSKQPPGWGDPFSGGQFQSIVVNNGGAGYDGVSGDWPTAVPYVPLVITGDGTGAAGYAVIDHATGKIIGVYLTNPGKNYTNATVTANGQGGAGATFTYSFTNIQALNPAATAYLQQRRVFGGSTLKPETLVMSQPGLITNFNVTPVTLATDALVISIAAEEVNTIRSFVQVAYGLLAFTTGGSFLINGGTPGAPIDANSPSIQPQVSQGANSLRPLRINYDVIYGQAKGNRVHNLAFAWQKQSYAGGDVSMLAAHLFDTFMTVDWAYAEEPFKIIWTVRNDGRLLSFTYVPDQEVQAWCRHDTQGAFRSVCSVPEGNVDAVYVIVERHVPNALGNPCWVYYLERMAERQGCCIYDAWHLDCALSLDNPTNTSPLYITPGVSPAVTLNTYDPCSSVHSGNFGGKASIPVVTGIQNFDLTPMTHRNGGPSIDFNGTLFIGNAFDGQVASYSFPGYTLKHGPVTASWGNNGLMFNEGDNRLYGWDGATNVAILRQVDTSNLTVMQSFGVASSSMPTDATHWAYPKDVDTAQDGSGKNYLISTALNASQTNGQISVLRLHDAPFPISWDGVDHHTDEVLGVVTKGNIEVGNGIAWVVTRTANLGGSISIGLYKVLLFGGVSTMRKVGLINPTTIGPIWTHITNCLGVVLDAKDGNIIAQFSTQDLAAWSSVSNYFAGDLVHSGTHDFVSKVSSNLNHVPTVGGDAFWTDLGVPGSFSGGQTRFVKINVTNGHVMWTTQVHQGIIGDQQLNQSRCQYGRINWVDGQGGATAKLVSIDTKTGVATTGGNLTFLSMGNQFFDDYTGNTFFDVSYGVGTVLQIGATPNSFSSWATLGPAAGPAIPAAAPPTVVGDVIQVGCGKVLITGQASPQQVSGNIIADLDLTVPDDPDGLMFPVDPGLWTITTPVSTVSGLDHLEGKQVYALADGVVEGPFTVAGGSVTLTAPASNVIVGLKFTAQLQTLYLTTQGIQQGSEQGKRKQISGVTVRVDCASGLKAGTDFDYLTPIPELNQDLATGSLYTGDARVLSFPQWDRPGQTCVQQDLPLPATVLGVIVEVTPGDTGS